MNMIPFTAVVLAGGIGTRLGHLTPKQYLPLKEKPIITYCLDLLCSMQELEQLIIVCQPEFRHFFNRIPKTTSLKFALPGERRQDSLFNALKVIEGNPLVCVHDGARPFIETELVRKVILAASHYEAAALGVKVKSTIKMCDENDCVAHTPPRSSLWEIQTPQVIRCDLLKMGFKYAEDNHLTVTDDVSLVEALGRPVKIVEGSYTNIKITTADDLTMADHFLNHYVFL